MAKIKIFQDEDINRLEKKVNDWIDQHPTFKIIDVKPASRPCIEHFEKRQKDWHYLSQTILYKETDE